MQIVVGVDTHKAQHVLSVLSSLGEEVDHFTIPATPEGYGCAVKRIEKLSNDVRWGIEGAYCYGQGFADFLQRYGAVVYEVPGSVSKRHRRQSTHHGKTDPIDARAVAQAVMLESERLGRYELSEEHEAVRLLYDRRDRLVRHRTETISRARAQLHFLGIFDVPVNLAKPRSLKRIRMRLGEVQITAVGDSIRIEDIQECLHDIERSNDRIRAIEAQLRPFVDKLGAPLLELRGVSLIVAAGIVGHTGTLRNCRDAHAFAMYAGTAPVPCSSGKHAAMRLNRGGNRQLNRLLQTIAITQLRASDHAGRIYYDRKRAEGKPHRAALRSLKRQLATVVYYRLRAAQTQTPGTAYAVAA